MTDPAEIYPLLEDAVRWCSREASRSPKDAAILEAVRRRLLLRQTILQAIQRPVDAQSKTASKYWSLCETLIGDIQETSSFGNEPDGAVSPKLQRKLASTAPPRPVNTLNTDLAFPVAKQLYKDCREIVTILQAQSTADLMVSLIQIYEYMP